MHTVDKYLLFQWKVVHTKATALKHNVGIIKTIKQH